MCSPHRRSPLAALGLQGGTTQRIAKPANPPLTAPNPPLDTRRGQVHGVMHLCYAPKSNLRDKTLIYLRGWLQVQELHDPFGCAHSLQHLRPLLAHRQTGGHHLVHVQDEGGQLRRRRVPRRQTRAPDQQRRRLGKEVRYIKFLPPTPNRAPDQQRRRLGKEGTHVVSKVYIKFLPPTPNRAPDQHRRRLGKEGTARIYDVTGPPVPITARVHSTPQRPFCCGKLYILRRAFTLVRWKIPEAVPWKSPHAAAHRSRRSYTDFEYRLKRATSLCSAPNTRTFDARVSVSSATCRSNGGGYGQVKMQKRASARGRE
eukprot:1186605-Prorocentrum_minimum.AAC.1